MVKATLGKMTSHPNVQKIRKHPYFRWFSILVVLALLILLYRCSSSHPQKAKGPKATPVILAIAQKEDVPVYISALGAVSPTYNVTVKTQVNGQLLNVNFKEGQKVKKGELLAEIDPRPYEALLTQYQGQLARDQALLENSKIDLQRYQVLYKQNSVAQQTLETQKWLVKQYEGNIKLDQGLIEAAQVNLTYTKIISPIDGQIGLRLVDPGNNVQTTDPTGLFVINTLQPITVIFSIPEDSLPQVLERIRNGYTLKVEAYDRTQNKLLATGYLLTTDNQIDPTTGTIKLRAEFKNENGALFPNQFVNIKLQVDTLHQATIVPTVSIQRGTQGTFIFLANPNQTVTLKPVKINAVFGNDSAISGDIVAGQSVVLEGNEKLTNGAAIVISKNHNNHAINETVPEQNSTTKKAEK